MLLSVQREIHKNSAFTPWFIAAKSLRFFICPNIFFGIKIEFSSSKILKDFAIAVEFYW